MSEEEGEKFRKEAHLMRRCSSTQSAEDGDGDLTGRVEVAGDETSFVMLDSRGEREEGGKFRVASTGGG